MAPGRGTAVLPFPEKTAPWTCWFLFPSNMAPLNSDGVLMTEAPKLNDVYLMKLRRLWFISSYDKGLQCFCLHQLFARQSS